MKRIKSLKSITTRDIRQNSHTLTQHVGLKAHNGVDIFREDEDREQFMKSINKVCEKYEVELLVCVQMTNHVHLILKGEIEQFKFVFESVGATFARWHNFKYGNKGAFWDQRYYNLPINTRRQFLNCAAYIFNNPVKAGMVEHPQDYEWSNFNALRLGYEDAGVCKSIDELVGIGLLVKTTIDRSNDILLLRQQRNLELVRDARICDVDVQAKAEALGCKKDSNPDELSKEKRKSIVAKLWEFGANVSQIMKTTNFSRKFVSETVEFL